MAYVHMHLKVISYHIFFFPLIKRNRLHGKRTDANIPCHGFLFLVDSSDSDNLLLLLAFYECENITNCAWKKQILKSSGVTVCTPVACLLLAILDSA